MAVEEARRRKEVTAMTTIERWRPFERLLPFDEDLWRRFEQLFDAFGLVGRGVRTADWIPACDVLTRGDDLVVRVELPGIDPERDLEVTVEDGMLCLRGERHLEREEAKEGYLRRESASGRFERALRLPEGVRPEDLRASYHDGVLEVVLPGAAAPTAQKVPIEVASKGGALPSPETGGEHAVEQAA
jgi:HSP20 family protein